MRILLDACVPRGLRRHLSGHVVTTAHEKGWGDLDNGDLLDAMGADFDVLITMDRGIPHQQQLSERSFGLLLLRARSNRLADLVPLAPHVLQQLASVKPGSVVVAG